MWCTYITDLLILWFVITDRNVANEFTFVIRENTRSINQPSKFHLI